MNTKITLPAEALAALKAEGAALTAPPKPLTDKVVLAIRKQVVKTIFGPTMKPTFKQQLLTFSSFDALKAGWAADHWQRIMATKAVR